MVQLLATIANDPELMPSSLHALRGLIEAPDSEAPANEVWGVGYHAEDRGLIARKPASILEERSAWGIGHALRSRVLLTCAGATTLRANLPPYRFRRWLFGYSGDLSGLGALQAHVAPKLPSFVRDALGDDHGGHLVHCMFLTELHRDGLLEDGLASPDAVGAALERTAETVIRLAPEAGVEAVKGTLTVSNGRMLVVTRMGQPLFQKHVAGLERLPDGPVDETLHDFKRVAEALKRFRAEVFATGLSPDVSDWTTLPERGTTVVDAALDVRHLG